MQGSNQQPKTGGDVLAARCLDCDVEANRHIDDEFGHGEYGG
jgi:hypothetical protein